MTYTLGVDTSHEVAVGLAEDGNPVDRIIISNTRAHAEEVLPAALSLCQRNGLTLTEVDEIAIGMGPGPFTGLRVGISTAWTLAFLGGTEPIGVCSLDVIAHQWQNPPKEFVVASDARRKELYWARYVDGLRVEGPKVSAPGEVPPLPMAGPALKMLIDRDEADSVPHQNDVPEYLDPAVLAAVAGKLPRFNEPLYLRGADATVSTRVKSALPKVRR